MVTISLEFCSFSFTFALHLHHPISNKIDNGGILAPAYLGYPGKWPLKECVVVVDVTTQLNAQSTFKLSGDLWLRQRNEFRLGLLTVNRLTDPWARTGTKTVSAVDGDCDELNIFERLW